MTSLMVSNLSDSTRFKPPPLCCLTHKGLSTRLTIVGLVVSRLCLIDRSNDAKQQPGCCAQALTVDGCAATVLSALISSSQTGLLPPAVPPFPSASHPASHWHCVIIHFRWYCHAIFKLVSTSSMLDKGKLLSHITLPFFHVLSHLLFNSARLPGG